MRLRLSLILLALPGVLLAVPIGAAAQSQPGSGASWSLPPIGLPLEPIGLPLEPIGLPLSPIGLPLPELGLPPVRTPVSEPDRPPAPAPRTSPPKEYREENEDRRVYGKPRIVHGLPSGWTPPRYSMPVAPTPLPPPAAPRQTTGTLWLEIEPSTSAQIYVNDFFVDTAENLAAGVTLETGTYLVEIRAAGYRTVGFQVRIDADRAVTYRDTLQLLAPAEPELPLASPAPVVRKPLYFIPGCYLGDVRPEAANLPASCDPRLAITFRP